MAVVHIPHKANTAIIRLPSEIKSWGVTGFGGGLPKTIKNTHDYLRYIGIKLSGSDDALKRFRLSSEQLGELYFNLFVNRVDTLVVKTGDFDLQDLLSLSSEKFSFIPRKGVPRPRLIQSGQEITLPEKVIIRVQFSHPRDITKRVEMINTIIRTIEQAEKSIYVAMFSFTNDEIAKALIAAEKRGVEVRVILDKAQAQQKNSQYENLKKAGIKVILGDLTVHHKFTIIDERGVFTGSLNLTLANKRNYEDQTYVSGEGEAAATVQKFLERFLKLHRTFSLGLGTLVKPENPLLQGLEFGHTLAPLDLVKELEIRLTRITESEYLELIDLLKTKQFKFRVKKVELLRPLFEGITSESNYLINALLHNKKIINSIPLRFFFDAASPSKRYHKSHVNRVGGLFEHSQEVAAWGKALSEAQGLPEQIRNEIIAGAAYHDIFPGLYRKGYARLDRARLTADQLEYELNEFLESSDEDAQESLKRNIESIRNSQHVWGGTPLGPNNSINDWNVALANQLASLPNVFIFKSEITPEKEQEIINPLLERPLTNPRETYLRILERDENLRSQLKQVTGQDSFFDLMSEDERILDLTYSLLFPFLLNGKDAVKSDKEQERAVLKKQKTIRAVLMASLLAKHRIQGINRLADRAQKIKMKLFPKTNKLLWPICIANWISEQKNMRIFSYGDVRRALKRIEIKEKAWAPEKDYDPAELRKFTLDLQEVAFDELSHEFVPVVEEQFRNLISSRYRIKFKRPVASEVIKWMIHKAGTLQAERIYKFFLGPLKPKARKRFLEALRAANEEDFDSAVTDKLWAKLDKMGLPAGKIIGVLGQGYGKASRKTVKEINSVLHNAGIREPLIESILEDIYKLEEKRIPVEKINILLVKHKIPAKTITSIIRSLLEIDPWETENPPRKLERILKDDLKIDDKFRTEIFLAYKNILLEEAGNHIENLCKQNGLSHKLPKGRILPEFGALAKVILGMQNIDAKKKREEIRKEINDWLKATRDLSFQVHTEKAEKEMESVIEIVKSATENKEKILVYGDARLNGAISVALLVETLRDLGMPEELVGYHIPDITKEGFNLNSQVIQKKYEEGYQTIITANNGIKSNEAIDLAKKLGMKVVVIDGHPASAKDRSYPTNADAIVHSGQEDRPGVELCYEVARTLLGKARIPKGSRFLDLVALGALANIGSLAEKERKIVYWGLRVLNSLNRNIGLDTLMEIWGLKEKPMDGLAVGSKFIPLLKAACYLNKGKEVVELILAKDKTESLIQAEKLMGFEKEERAKEEKMLKQAREKLEDQKRAPGIALSGSFQPLGVMGPVAAQLSRELYLPVALINAETGIGEIRSSPEICLPLVLHIMNQKYLQQHSEPLFAELIAHLRAAYFVIARDKINEFKALFSTAIRESLRDEAPAPKIKIAANLPFLLISKETNALFEAVFAPFKWDHEFGETDEPILKVEGAQIREWLPEGKHLLLWSDGKRFFAYRGNNPELKKKLFEKSRKAEIAFTLGTRFENGKEDIRLRLIDIREFKDKGKM